MYYDYDEFENYYEPTPADEIFTEAMEKFKDVLKAEVKDNLKYIQEENIKLKRENEELKNKARTLDSRERDLKRKEEDFANNSEYNFYKKKFSEILNPFIEQLDVWYVESVHEFMPKCNLCDNERQVEFKNLNGKTIKGDCDCNKTEIVYKVVKSEFHHLDFYKNSRNGREFIVTPKYEANGEYDEKYLTVNLQKLINTFDIEKAQNYVYSRGYGKYSAFTNKEECQKYCDWLNSNKQKDLNEYKE